MYFPKFAGVFIYISQLERITCHTKSRNAITNPGFRREDGSIYQEGTRPSKLFPLGNIDENLNCNQSGVNPAYSEGNPVTLLEDTGVIPYVKRRCSLPIRNTVNQGCLEEGDKACWKELDAVRPGRAIRSGAPSFVDTVIAPGVGTGSSDLLPGESSAVGDGNKRRGRGVGRGGSSILAQSDGSLKEEVNVDPEKIERDATPLHEQNTLL